MESIVIYASEREAMEKNLTQKELRELTEKLAHEKLSNIIRLKTPSERQKQATEGPMHWWVGSVGTGRGQALRNEYPRGNNKFVEIASANASWIIRKGFPCTLQKHFSNITRTGGASLAMALPTKNDVNL